MSNTTVKKMTAEEFKQGYTVCPCGKYAHIFRATVLQTLPTGYSGELCAECSMWMADVDKLQQGATA